ncbi:MAG: hypothetical protein PVF89_08605 [Lysobacterales bacterium]|jgi:chemotaxis protein CheY-P-specific phosphatase CheC
MNVSTNDLTAKQVDFFDHFLIDGTQKALHALDSMFGLDIDSSDSSIEIAPGDNSEFLQQLGSGSLYTVSSSMTGDLQGRILLLLRAGDFRTLIKIMKPILSLLLQPDDGDRENPPDKADFHKEMMDILSEMANILIGLYAKSIYKICDITTHYSVPKIEKDSDQQAIRQFLSASAKTGQPQLVIENEFYVTDKPVKLWFLIAPTPKSFAKILRKIEQHADFNGATLTMTH